MNITQKHVIVFDLDNCLFEDESRMHLIKNGNKHGEVANLPACPVSANMLWSDYHKAGLDAEAHHADFFHAEVEALPRHNSHVVFLTARPEMFKGLTVAALERAGFASVRRWTLLMRPNDRLESSPKLKPVILADWLRNNGMSLDHVACVFDDRRDVLESFRALGVHTQLLAIKDRG